MSRASSTNRRDGGLRVTICDPYIILKPGEQRVPVEDFSRTGFYAALPPDLMRVGATAEAELHFTTSQLENRQDIRFEVVRATPNGLAGVVYTVSHSASTRR